MPRKKGESSRIATILISITLHVYYNILCPRAVRTEERRRRRVNCKIFISRDITVNSFEFLMQRSPARDLRYLTRLFYMIQAIDRITIFVERAGICEIVESVSVKENSVILSRHNWKFTMPWSCMNFRVCIYTSQTGRISLSLSLLVWRVISLFSFLFLWHLTPTNTSFLKKRLSEVQVGYSFEPSFREKVALLLLTQASRSSDSIVSIVLHRFCSGRVNWRELISSDVIKNV